MFMEVPKRTISYQDYFVDSNRRIKLYLKVIFYLSLIYCLCPTVDLQAAPSQQEAQKKLTDVQIKIQKSQHKLEKDRGQIGQLEKKLRESEQLIGQLNQQLKEAQSTLVDTQKRIGNLEAQKKNLFAKLSKHRAILHAQIRSEYLYSGQEKLKLLLNQKEPTKLGQTLVYYDYLHRARLEEIDQAMKILQHVRQVQEEIVEQKNLADKFKNNLLDKKQSLEQQQKKRKTVLADLNVSISSEQAKLASLGKDEKTATRTN